MWSKWLRWRLVQPGSKIWSTSPIGCRSTCRHKRAHPENVLLSSIFIKALSKKCTNPQDIVFWLYFTAILMLMIFHSYIYVLMLITSLMSATCQGQSPCLQHISIYNNNLFLSTFIYLFLYLINQFKKEFVLPGCVQVFRTDQVFRKLLLQKYSLFVIFVRWQIEIQMQISWVGRSTNFIPSPLIISSKWQSINYKSTSKDRFLWR